MSRVSLPFGSSVVLLALCACAAMPADPSTSDPYGGSAQIAPDTGMVRLPPGSTQDVLGGSREVVKGVLVEKLVLVNATTVPRDNVVRVRTRWRGIASMFWFGAEMESPFTTKAVQDYFSTEFPGAQAPQMAVETANMNGPYMYYLADLGAAGSCVYAWQMTMQLTEMRHDTRPFAVDYRFCGPDKEPAKLLALFNRIELSPRL